MPKTSRVPELRGLYAVTPDCAATDTLLTAVVAVLRGGCRWVQYRDKTAIDAERQIRAAALRRLTREYGAGLIINDDVVLVQTVRADGVHLGRDDGELAEARRRLGPEAIIGASCYADLKRARQAAAAGASYVAFGAVYPSATKPSAMAVPLDVFAAARAQLAVPVCAIGGLTLDNAPPVIAAGAQMLAVVNSLFAAPDPMQRSQSFQLLFQE